MENLKSIEASHMVYTVYENFIVPRICADNTKTYLGRKKAACKLRPFAKEESFQKLSGDPTGILFQPKEKLVRSLDFKFEGAKPKLLPVAPKNYEVTHVGCYRTQKNRELKTDCELFFMILQSPNETPILAVKGSSSREDWINNLKAGAPILSEITSVFTGLLGEMREGIMGGESYNAQELKGVVPLMSDFFLGITKKSDRMIFTGHSLGGALAQELAREVFVATRSSLNSPASGPRVKVITWNSLSYTSMLGELRKSVSKLVHPIRQAGWSDADIPTLEDYKSFYDGVNLSAVNFYTADDILTQLINHSVIGQILRLKAHHGEIHAGADVLLATKRKLEFGLMAAVKGHYATTLLQDAFYSFGGTTEGATLSAVGMGTQISKMKSQIEKEEANERYHSSPRYFYDTGRNPELYNKDGSPNLIDRAVVWKEVQNDRRRSEKYDEMLSTLVRHSQYYGRLESGKNYNSYLTAEYYR